MMATIWHENCVDEVPCRHGNIRQTGKEKHFFVVLFEK